MILYHSKNTRSVGTLVLLEELGAKYELKKLDIRAGENRTAEYLAVNPMGKVPALEHNGTIITEQVAIYIYLADLFSESKIAPLIGDSLRGSYLRWMTFYGSCFEPAVVDRSLKRDAGPVSMSPYGSFDLMLNTLLGQLKTGPWLLGEKLTALDVLYGGALGWMTKFELVPSSAIVKAYVERFNERPAVKRVQSMDA